DQPLHLVGQILERLHIEHDHRRGDGEALEIAKQRGGPAAGQPPPGNHQPARLDELTLIERTRLFLRQQAGAGQSKRQAYSKPCRKAGSRSHCSRSLAALFSADANQSAWRPAVASMSIHMHRAFVAKRFLVVGRGLGANRRGITLAHQLATLRTGRMYAVALELRDEGANLVQALAVEPARLHAAPDRVAVGAGLGRADELVAALVIIDVELHRRGEAPYAVRVENEIARIGPAPAVEPRIDHRRPLAAAHRSPVERHLALCDFPRASLGVHIFLDGRAGDGLRPYPVPLEGRNRDPPGAAVKAAAAEKRAAVKRGKHDAQGAPHPSHHSGCAGVRAISGVLLQAVLILVYGALVHAAASASMRSISASDRPK